MLFSVILVTNEDERGNTWAQLIILGKNQFGKDLIKSLNKMNLRNNKNENN